MSLDSDIALIGTGLAPLIAASYWIAQGRSVLVLNPDSDFFLENSELPLDPLFKERLKIHRVSQNLPDHTLNELRPLFPGSVEFWPDQRSIARAVTRKDSPRGEYHDPSAPHVRSRTRLWIESPDSRGSMDATALDDFYVQASDEGLHPQLLDGVQSKRKFPGVSSTAPLAYADEVGRGLVIPRLCDVDLTRYRNGVLEFVRERLGPDRMVSGASQIERIPSGLRFRHGGSLRALKVSEGILAFWTPRMSSWIFSQAKDAEELIPTPGGLRLWEQWKISSREPLSPDTVGIYNGELAVWADCEGAPDPAKQPIHTLSVLRASNLMPLSSDFDWASRESFESLSRLCQGFLKWDRFSVQSMVPRAILDWERPGYFHLEGMHVLSDCDGPISRVARNVRVACEKLGGTPHE